jgi:hypothetical protein
MNFIALISQMLKSIIINFLCGHSGEGWKRSEAFQRYPGRFKKLVFRMPDQVRHHGETMECQVMTNSDSFSLARIIL